MRGFVILSVLVGCGAQSSLGKGAMGLGLGTVQVIRHDGAGGGIVEDRPFVIQRDDAMVELGTVTAR